MSASRKLSVKIPSKAQEEILDDLASFEHDPYGFVLWAFDWESNPELTGKGPEPWQEKLLIEIRDGLKTVGEVVREAVRSGHGIGKSALVSWLIIWATSTKGDTRGVVTANTETQLRTKTWPELSKWFRLFIAKHLFTLTATALFSNDKGHEKSWRIDAVTWSEENTEAFAGLHNKNKRILVIFDEASSIPDKIWEVTEGALTDQDTEIIWCAFGNPTRNTGRFHDCFNAMRHRWKTQTVDSRTVSFTNKAQIGQWIADYGEDSDFVRVRVRGIEPKSAEGQFISYELVEKARGKHLNPAQYSFAPVIVTLDPSWTGPDEWVIGKRQGLAFSILAHGLKNDDDFKLAGTLARYEDEEKADAVFIDIGYGTGVYSAGKQLNRHWSLVEAGGASTDKGFLNKRAEMWKLMRDWLKDGGAIPNDPILCADLTGPLAEVVQTGKNAGKIFLESKKDMKERGVPSPNRADALALSFAAPVQKKDTRAKSEFTNRVYDPLEMHLPGQPPAPAPQYDPLRY